MTTEEAVMNNKRAPFWAFLCLNVLAAYAPALLWVWDVPGSANTGWEFLISPVALVLLIVWVTNEIVGWGILIGFILLIGLASSFAYRWGMGRIALPCVLVVYSLIQGLLAAGIISGIDAMGHS
jgi:hypothetical protein